MQATRRNFIKQLGYVSIGFSLMGATCMDKDPILGTVVQDPLNTLPPGDQIKAWLRILENGQVRILTGKMELGQGIGTALMQLAAEELNTTMDRVQLQLAETGVTQDEGYTAGSRSIETSGISIRNAAATARELILEMAAKKWGIPSGQLQLEDGKVSGAGQEADLHELLQGQQLRSKVGKPAQLFGKTRRRLVGNPAPRKDIVDMVMGKRFFLHDLRFPGMVHARVVRPKTYSAKFVSVDMKALEQQQGFLKLLRIGSFVGVLAEGEYQAIRLKELAEKSAKWEYQENLPTNIPLKEHLKTLAGPPETETEKGHWERAIRESPLQHRAAYYKPYIMHAANGPSCAVARFQDGLLEVWSHSQGVYPLRRTLANLLQIPENDIHIKGVPGSGCYGHNGADDVAAEAALMAVEYPGKHVRLQWMREDEHGWEPYGTAMIMELEAGLTANGRIQGWTYELWSDGHSTRPGGDAVNLLPARFLEKGFGSPGGGYKGGAVRNSLPYYHLDNLRIQLHSFNGPLRVSALRGLGAYANIFAIECFMDELAEKAGHDPITFRLLHLEDERARTCLERLRNVTQGMTLQKGEGLGYAFSRYKNEASYCAVAALVKVDTSSGKVRAKKMWGVIDSGEAINPDGLKNQTEGGMVQSASWALVEEVRFNGAHISSLDWNSYPILRFPDTPEVEVVVIDRSDQPPLGAGEAAQGPATAALVNAIFNATGVRIRELPIRPGLLTGV